MELPIFLKKQKCKVQIHRTVRKKKFNKNKLLNTYRKRLPKAWKEAYFSHVLIGNSFPANAICGYRNVFWKKISKGRNKNKTAFRNPYLDRIYLINEKDFMKSIKENY